MSAPTGVGSWVNLIVPLSLLFATGAVVYVCWMLGNRAGVPSSSSATIVLGTTISLPVGLVSWRSSPTVAEEDMTNRLS